jgi:hypothetical protein
LFCIEKFRLYLEHHEFIFETNNQALSWFLSHPRQLEKIGSGLVRISCKKFQVSQVRGTWHIVADTLTCAFEGYDPQGAASSTHAVLKDSPLASHYLRWVGWCSSGNLSCVKS